MPLSGDEIAEAMLDGAEEALAVMAPDLAGRAQAQAPVLTGALRGSADWEVTRRGRRVEAEVSFNMVYAEVQHERLDYEHPKGGKAKYLEDPLTAMAPRYERTLGQAAKVSLARRMREAG